MGGAARAFWILAVAAVIGLVAYLAWPRPLPVETVTARHGVLVRRVENEGRTHMRDRHVVAAPIAGIQSRIGLKVGDPVDRKTVIATISPGLAPLDDPRTRRQLVERLGAAEAARQRADAVVARAEARVAQARADLARTAALVTRGVAPIERREQDQLALTVGEREMEVARFEADMAGHEVDLARAALDLTRGGDEPVGRDRVEIRSPIDGVVLKVAQESAGPVALGAQLVEIGDPERLEILVDVLTTDAVAIRPGAPAAIERWGGPKPLAATVRRVEPAGFTKVSALGVDEQRVNVLLDLVSPREDWRALGDGFRVEALIEVERLEDAVIVPVSALVRDGGGWAVFAVSNGRVAKRPVELRRRAAREAAIAGGGVAGGTVLVDFPSETLADGERVAPRGGPQP